MFYLFNNLSFISHAFAAVGVQRDLIQRKRDLVQRKRDLLLPQKRPSVNTDFVPCEYCYCSMYTHRKRDLVQRKRDLVQRKRDLV